MSDAESLAVDAILDALTREGPHPRTHRAAIAGLRRDFPRLYDGLVLLARARGVALPPPGTAPARGVRLEDVERAMGC